jgi:hypothetical protein
MRDVKDIAHLTNAYIAKEADVSIKTVERIMAINVDQDIMRAVARRIELVVIGPVGKHICELDYDGNAAERINSLLAEAEYWRKETEYWRKENDRKAKIIDKYLDS